MLTCNVVTKISKSMPAMTVNHVFAIDNTSETPRIPQDYGTLPTPLHDTIGELSVLQSGEQCPPRELSLRDRNTRGSPLRNHSLPGTDGDTVHPVRNARDLTDAGPVPESPCTVSVGGTQILQCSP